MRFPTTLAMLALIGLPGQLHAADCSSASATVEMNQCAEKEYAAADSELNAVYQATLAKIAKTTGEKPYDAKSWEAALRASQRAWVGFRDAQCKGLVPMQWSGGTGSTSAVLNCMTTLTRERVAMLKDGSSGLEGPARVP